MSTVPLTTSDTLGTMSTQSSTHYATTDATEKKGDSSITVSTIQSAPSQAVIVDAKLFAQMQLMLASQMAQAQSQVRNEPTTITLPSGSKYIGQLNQEGKPHGRGFLTYTEGNPRLNYEGEFENGNPHGQGTLKMVNGDKFVGHFKNGQTTTGRMTEPSGHYYLGEWQNGEFWEGTYNRMNQNGIWEKRPYRAGEVPCCYNSGTGEPINCVIL